MSLVAPLNAVDRLADYLALERLPLPEPDDTIPSGERVDAIAVTTHWVPTADVGGPNVGKALSACSAAGICGGWWAMPNTSPTAPCSADLDWNRGTLDRRQIELLAAKTSLLNDCFY